MISPSLSSWSRRSVQPSGPGAEERSTFRRTEHVVHIKCWSAAGMNTLRNTTRKHSCLIIKYSEVDARSQSQTAASYVANGSGCHKNRSAVKKRKFQTGILYS